MGWLYLRYKTKVYFGFYDKQNRLRRINTGRNIFQIRRRDGKIIWPPDLLDLQEKLEAQLALGKFGLTDVSQSRLCFQEVLSRFRENGVNRSRKTLGHYQLAGDMFVDLVGNLPLAEITEEKISAFVRTMKGKKHQDKPYSVRTIDSYIRSLRAFFAWCVRKRLINHNPVTSDVRLKVPPRPIRTFDARTIEQVLVEAEKIGGMPLVNVYQFMQMTGFRISETTKLRWDAVRFDDKVIEVLSKDGKRIDNFPIYPVLLEFLTSLPKDYSPYVFKYRSNSFPSHAMTRIVKNLKLDPLLNLHSLRRTFATRLYRAGIPAGVTQRLMRHESYSTTLKVYTANELEPMKNAMEQMEEAEKELRKVGNE